MTSNMSGFVICMTHFAIVRRKTSPTPIGLTDPSPLSNVISLHDKSFSRNRINLLRTKFSRKFFSSK